MIGSYRIHQEQIKKVEQSLKAPYRRRWADPCLPDGSGMATMQVNRKKREDNDSILLQMSLTQNRKNTRSAPGSKQMLRPDSPNLPPPPVPAMRCMRCNARIHQMDYLYTKKTGLCIPCWEKQEA